MFILKHLKTLLCSIAVFCWFTTQATNYYLSNSGNDSNPGTSPSEPWQSLDKLNSFKLLRPGDSVLFKRGDIFYGRIRLENTGGQFRNFGINGYPIVFSSYGSGAKPVITGFTRVVSWKKVSGNVWESTARVSGLSNCKLVAINGMNTPMGRYPNSGWKTISSATKNSITDHSLPATNWTGGEIVTRVERPVIGKYQIEARKGITLEFHNQSRYQPKAGWGYFIQNHIATLDTDNEWYFNPATGKISVYSSQEPKNVQVASVDTLVTVFLSDHITFDDIRFEGSNMELMMLGSSNGVTIQNCDFEFSGQHAIWARNFWKGYTSNDLQIKNNKFRNSNNYGIYLESEKKNAYIGYNNFDSTAMVPGGLDAGDAKGIALMSLAENVRIEYNTVKNSGYTAIYFAGNGTIVKNNLVDGFCLIKDDGGGIYTWVDKVEHAYRGQKILDNIVLNGKGNVDGVNDGSNRIWTDGIYLDNRTSFTEVKGNTVAHCSRAGIFPYRGYGNLIHYNVCYDNAHGIRFQDDLGSVTRDTVKHNIFFARTADQFPATFQVPKNNFSTLGVFDSNFYVKPLQKDFVIEKISGEGEAYRREIISLEAWRHDYLYDLHSQESPVSIPAFSYRRVSENKFQNGSFDSNIEGVSWWSANGNVVGGWNNEHKIDGGSLQIIFSRPSSTNTLPSVTIPVGMVSAKKTYVLKFSSLGTNNGHTLYATLRKTNPDWSDLATRIPTAITTSRTDNEILLAPIKDDLASISLTWNDKELNKTFWIDNIELFEVDAVKTDLDDYFLFEYNASSQTRTVYLSESYVDPTGKKYERSFAIAPFKSVVLIKDTTPSKGSELMIDAGDDQVIMLPLQQTTLNGNVRHADRKIIRYEWKKISGPAGELIQDADSAKTVIKNLTPGVYRFEFTVTTQDGFVAKDTTQVTVRPAQNKLPVADAGRDKKISLPTNVVTLEGNGTDADGKIVGWLWTRISGLSSCQIESPSARVTNVSGLVAGVYRFELRVKDDQGGEGKDTVTVTVLAAENKLPVADAGRDKKIGLPTNVVTLEGNGTDGDGKIVGWLWTRISGPPSCQIESPSARVTNVSGLVAGVYRFELKVKDNQGGEGKDTVTVTVLAAENKLPVADAGRDKKISLPANVVTLEGNGTDADGKIVEWLWTKVSGPAAYHIVNAKSPLTDVSGLIEGVYHFELRVTDDKGGVGKDTMQVEVIAKSNVSPVANAGPDMIIEVPLDSVVLSGGGVDPDGTIVSFLWTLVSGPGSPLIHSPHSAMTKVSRLTTGVYTFRLAVQDNKGAKAHDTLMLTVNKQQSFGLDNHIEFFPNPVRNTGRFRAIVSKADGDYIVTLSDSNGKIYLNEKAHRSERVISHNIDMTLLARGVYFLTVCFDNQIKRTLKIVKM